MSFSRRIGASPSMMRRVRWSSLVMTLSPTMMRSPAFNSTLRPIGYSFRITSRHFERKLGLLKWLEKKTAGLDPRRIFERTGSDLAEQPENLLFLLVGQ